MVRSGVLTLEYSCAAQLGRMASLFTSPKGGGENIPRDLGLVHAWQLAATCAQGKPLHVLDYHVI